MLYDLIIHNGRDVRGLLAELLLSIMGAISALSFCECMAYGLLSHFTFGLSPIFWIYLAFVQFFCHTLERDNSKCGSSTRDIATGISMMNKPGADISLGLTKLAQSAWKHW